jgi:hypothetical protein
MLCPSCTSREATTPEGWCAECVLQRAAEQYSKEDRRLADKRRAAWGTGDPYALLRRQRKRLIDVVRPRRSSVLHDPWEIAREALLALQHMRGRDATVLDEVAEAIRRLAWGPDDGVVMVENRHRTRRQIPGQLALWELEEAMAA